MNSTPLTPDAETARRDGLPPDARSGPVALYRIRPLHAASTLVAAVAVGLLVWVVATPLGGLELVVAAAGQRVGPFSITVAALLGGAAAWLLLALLRRHPRGPVRWTLTGIVVLVLSLAGPPLSGAAGAVLVALEAMHLLVALVLILGLRRSVVPRRPAGGTVTTEVP